MLHREAQLSLFLKKNPTLRHLYKFPFLPLFLTLPWGSGWQKLVQNVGKIIMTSGYPNICSVPLISELWEQSSWKNTGHGRDIWKECFLEGFNQQENDLLWKQSSGHRSDERGTTKAREKVKTFCLCFYMLIASCELKWQYSRRIKMREKNKTENDKIMHSPCRKIHRRVTFWYTVLQSNPITVCASVCSSICF